MYRHYGLEAWQTTVGLGLAFFEWILTQPMWSLQSIGRSVGSMVTSLTDTPGGWLRANTAALPVSSGDKNFSTSGPLYLATAWVPAKRNNA